MKDLLIRVQEIIREHGLLTGQEFLDLTGQDMPLYNAYLAYWDSLIIPDLEEKIQGRIDHYGV